MLPETGMELRVLNNGTKGKIRATCMSVNQQKNSRVPFYCDGGNYTIDASRRGRHGAQTTSLPPADRVKMSSPS